MSRILAVGTGPLFEKGVRNFSAHCLRTWHFVKPMLDAGHEVALYTLPIFSDQQDLVIVSGVEKKEIEGFEYSAFKDCKDEFNLRVLNEACQSFRPDAMVGINSYPCSVLPRVSYVAPLWADFYGSVVFEGQAKSFVCQNNAKLGVYWNMERVALRRADRFSTVSMRQLYALHGELAAVGRMNRHTFSHRFATCIPSAYNPFLADLANREKGSLDIRGEKTPDDAFILLWSGGYNAWTDADVLFQGVESAMERCSDLHYVSTGGRIYGHDDMTYPRFREMVQGSRFTDRFHLLGWIDSHDLPRVYDQADLGLCVDSENLETMFGARTRLVSMLVAGLPALTTSGSEISDELIDAGVCLGCAQNGPQALADAIVNACSQRADLPQLGENGREHVLDRFNCETTTKEFLEWAAAPEFAPDNQVKIERAAGQSNPFETAANPIETEQARLESSAIGGAPGQPKSFFEPMKRLAERVVGKTAYNKLRFLRQHWWREYRPRYRERMGEIKAGKLGRLEDLYIFLTNQCNARCKHCFYIEELGQPAGELTLSDYEKLTPTLPPLRQLTLTGGEALLHPQCKEIAQLLGRATRAERMTIISNGFLPTRLEAICAWLLEEGLPGVLDVLISIDGLEETHNEIRGNPRAWAMAHYSLTLLRQIKALYPDRFDFGVITIITDKNHRQLEELNSIIRKRHECRHGFEFVRGTDISLWGMPADVKAEYNAAGVALPPEESWDAILATLKRINREAGIAHHAFHLTSEFAVRMFREKKRIVDCVSAGQNVGVIYPHGEVALCEFSKPFGKLGDHNFDFTKAWSSPKANAMRAKISRCHCAHGCYLSKNIEYSRAGQWAMVKDL